MKTSVSVLDILCKVDLGILQLGAFHFEEPFYEQHLNFKYTCHFSLSTMDSDSGKLALDFESQLSVAKLHCLKKT